MAFQIIGKIEYIGPIIEKPSNNGGQPFYSREFVLDATRYNPDTGEPWENHPKFELSSSRVSIIDSFQIGQRVVVDFALRGAKYPDKETQETKYFTSISAFKIVPYEQRQQTQYVQQSQPAYQPQAPAPQGPFPPQENIEGIGPDGLPF